VKRGNDHPFAETRWAGEENGCSNVGRCKYGIGMGNL